MLRAEQCAAEPGDQCAGRGELRELVPQIGQPRREVVTARDGEVKDLNGNGGGQQSAPAFSTDGAQIAEVSAGSTADKAGLKKGDVITKVNDQLITDSDSLVATIRSYRPGDKVTLTYTRGGKTSTVTLTLDSDAGGTKS